MPFNIKANKRIIKRNKYTIFSLIIIIAMLYVIRSKIPAKDIQYYEVVTYNNTKYKYEEIVKANPFRFVRAGSIEEGGLVLIMRKDKVFAVPKNIYIYAGSGRYLRYRSTI